MKILLVASRSGSWPYVPELRDQLSKCGDKVDFLDLDNWKMEGHNLSYKSWFDHLMTLNTFRERYRNLLRREQNKEGLSGLKAFALLAIRIARKLGILPLVRKLYLMLEDRLIDGRMGNLTEYDAINFHSLSASRSISRFRPFSHQRIGKIVVTIWGSEFLRATREQREANKWFYNLASAISFNNSRVGDLFVKWYQDYDSKVRIVRWGIGMFDVIEEEWKKSSLTSIKGSLGLDAERITICIGYNAGTAQQHLSVIKSIRDSLSDLFREKIQIIVPLSYGEDEEGYIQSIRELLSKSGLKYVILDTFLTAPEVARLRLASDIVINVQTTDSFSASIQEHILYGSHLIVGSWLPYQDIKAIHQAMTFVDDCSQTGRALVQIFESGDTLLFGRKLNKSLLNLSGWRTNIEKWRDLYRL